MDLSSIATCFEVTDDIVDEALRPAHDMNEKSPRERIFELLDHIAEIARPKQGAPRILRVLARVAGCDWVDGDLDVRVVSHGTKTSIELFVNDGLSVSKMRDALSLAVPYEELKKAMASKPELLRPLMVSGQVGATKTRLVAEMSGAGTSILPLSAADAELFSAAPMPAHRHATRRPPRPIPSPPPARARAMTMVGFAEPPPPAAPAVLGKVALAKRQVPASRRDPKVSDRSAPPRSKDPTKTSSGKRSPKPPRG